MLTSLIELAYNLAMLVALSMLSGFVPRCREHLVRGAVLQGLLFGGAAVIGMMRPLVLGPGLIFDGRSVMLSLCGLFFGPLAVGVAGGMALLYRFTLGGAGLLMGGLVIASSALLGLACHQRWLRKGAPLTAARLLGMGLLVHGAMLLLMFTLPAGMGLGVVQRLGLPILLVYPLVTLLIGGVLTRQAVGLRSAEALRASEEKHRLLLAHSHDIIYSLTLEGVFTYVAPAWTARLGHPVEQVEGHPFQAFVHPEDVELCQTWLQKVVTTGQRQEGIEYRVRHLDGSWRWHTSGGAPLRDAAGAVAGFQGTARDITDRKQMETSLRQEQQFSQSVLDSLPGIFYLYTYPELRLVLWNKRHETLLGFDAGEMAGRALVAWHVPEVQSAVLKVVEVVMEEGQSSVEAPLVAKDGRQVPFILTGVKFEAQGQRYLMGIGIDITERKRAEQALQDSQREYRRILWDMQVGVLLQDPRTEILLSNPKALELLGISEDQLLGKTSFDPDWHVLHEDGSPFPGATHPVAQAIATRQPVRDVVMGVYRPAKGDRVWLLVDAEPQLHGEGTVHQVVCTFIDITQRKQAEAALLQSEQKFRTLFENLTEGVALHELVQDETGKLLDYRILAVNPAYQVHTGIAATTAPGRLGTEIYGTDVPPYLEEFSKVALGGDPYVFETFFPPLEKHFRISVISPRPGQFATVFEDITDRKRREAELKQKNAEMERFTYMISHDLKSPLVTVQTFLGYLEQDLEQGRVERVGKDVTFIRDASNRMGRLLEDLLEVSRVGRVVNPPGSIALADLVQGALKAVAGAIATRGVAVQVEVSPIRLCGDRSRLEELWQNLVENAVKYMGDQPLPKITLGVEGRGSQTVFFVRDNGLGIDPRYQVKVFDLFEQLDAASEGTGLGLALVKRIVELYEGRIWLESEGLGHGSCFRFTLPLAMKDRNQGARS